MRMITNIAKSLIIISFSIIYLYIGRFMTLAIGMFMMAFKWDDTCLHFVVYMEQVLIMAILVWYILKEIDLIKWAIIAIVGEIILSFSMFSPTAAIVEDFYENYIMIDFIILQIISYFLYLILPSSRFKTTR